MFSLQYADFIPVLCFSVIFLFFFIWNIARSYISSAASGEKSVSKLLFPVSREVQLSSGFQLYSSFRLSYYVISCPPTDVCLWLKCFYLIELAPDWTLNKLFLKSYSITTVSTNAVAFNKCSLFGRVLKLKLLSYQWSVLESK